MPGPHRRDRLRDLGAAHAGHDDVGDEQVDRRRGCRRSELERRRAVACLEHGVARSPRGSRATSWRTTPSSSTSRIDLDAALRAPRSAARRPRRSARVGDGGKQDPERRAEPGRRRRPRSCRRSARRCRRRSRARGPVPPSFVVKNGSKSCWRSASVMPMPVSVSRSSTSDAGVGRRGSAVSIVTEPPCGIASRAFTARFTITCSICVGSARTDARLRVEHRRPARRPRRSGGAASCPCRETTAFRSSTRGCSTWRRLNASSWPVSAAARGRGLLDLLGVPPQPLVLLAGDQELGVAADRGQEVVEVVRDAAGEPADRLHLLRLAELLPRAPSGASGRG